MDCLAAHGISVKDINAFVQNGAIARVGSAHKLLVESPLRASSPSSALTVDGCSYDAAAKGAPLGSVPTPSTTDGTTPPALGPKSWTSVVSHVSNGKKLALSYIPPSVENGKVLVNPPTAILQKGNNLWASSLVRFFFHSRLPFKGVEPIAMRIWGGLGLSKVYLHDKGYYVLKFNSIESRDNILALGPWHFASRLIVLQPWKEDVDIVKDDCKKMPLWVKLSRIP